MSKPTFESKLQQIESIIQKMSAQSVSIDEISDNYQKANELITALLTQLETIEKEIELNESYSSVSIPVSNDQD